MIPRSVTYVLLPLIVFPTLSALAAQFLFGHLASSGAGKALGAHCLPSDFISAPYLLSYTGIRVLDRRLCPLVAFFHTVMKESAPTSFLVYFLGIGAPLVVIPALEAFRNGRSHLVKYPVIFGVLTQVATVGFILPIYWMIFVISGCPRKRQRSPLQSISQSSAEAVAFSLIIGAVIPSVAMLILNDPHVTMIWQFYPVCVSIAQYLYPLARPSFISPQSGYAAIQALYIGCFITSSSVHISTVWPLFTDLDALKSLLLPSITPLPSSAELSQVLVNFLKWDCIFAYASTSVATLWFAKDVTQIFIIISWYIAAIPTIGFGAAVMGVMIWTDGIL